MTGNRWEAAAAIAANVVYVLAVPAMLLVMMPGARMSVAVFARAQLQHWRYGRWLARQPRWIAELRRDDLPAERS